MKPIILVAMIFVVSCGNSKNNDLGTGMSGPTISGSSFDGAYLTFVAADTSVQATSLHYYDFSSGNISQVSSSEGRDPVAIWSSSAKTLTYIVRSLQSFRVFKIENNNPVDSKSGTLTDLGSGDPSDWHEASSGKFLFSNFHDQSVRLFESDSGYLSKEIDHGSLDLSHSGSAFFPFNLVESAGTYWVCTSGVSWESSSPAAVGSGSVFKIAGSDSSYSFADLNATTSGIQGATLSGSHPVYAEKNASDDNIRVLSLCRSDFGSSCVSAVDELNPKTGIVSVFSSLRNIDYEYFSTIVPGGSEDIVYAHVKQTSTGTFAVIKLNLKTKEITEVLKLPDSGLSLLLFDKSSDTLFVGSKSDGLGILYVLKAETLISTVKTREVPWQGVLVNP